MCRYLSLSYSSLFVVVLFTISPLSFAAEGDTIRVSVSPQGGGAMGGDSAFPSISADGRFIVFASDAENLVAGDINGQLDIFVRDTKTEGGGSTTRIIADSSRLESTGRKTSAPSISADGHHITFFSVKNLVAHPPGNGVGDIFVYDTAGDGTTSQVSVDSAETEGTYGISWSPAAISGNGRFIAFSSSALGLVPNDMNGRTDVFVRDTEGDGVTTRISIRLDGSEGGDGSSWEPAISTDGRYIVFASYAEDLVEGDTNEKQDVFVRDTEGDGTTTLVSVGLGASGGDGDSWAPSISADGRYITFASKAANLVVGDTNQESDVFVHDTQVGTTTRASIGSEGEEAMGGESTFSSISADGRYVAFQSAAHNLVVGDQNLTDAIFVRDLGTNTISPTTTRVVRAGVSPSISADGRYITFASSAEDLVEGDTNGKQDVFVYQQLPDAPPIPGDCDGDGDIDINDVICVINAVLNGDVAITATDCTGDGVLNIADIICEINLILGS